MVNVDLIHRTLDRIEAEPDRWSQEYFANKTPCGTTMCFAGHALIKAGYTLDGETFFGPKTGWTVPCVGEAAGHVLGLNRQQSDSLFYWIPLDPVTDKPSRISPADLRKRVAEALDDPQYLNSRNTKGDS